mmetsp:Transcript_25377/g.46000  ORF Transcript_25377/g.46000 Transcript_25377/m.46000 type:complete len:1626 (+) Transcript_25377:95-4972(+)
MADGAGYAGVVGEVQSRAMIAALPEDAQDGEDPLASPDDFPLELSRAEEQAASSTKRSSFVGRKPRSFWLDDEDDRKRRPRTNRRVKQSETRTAVTADFPSREEDSRGGSFDDPISGQLDGQEVVPPVNIGKGEEAYSRESPEYSPTLAQAVPSSELSHLMRLPSPLSHGEDEVPRERELDSPGPARDRLEFPVQVEEEDAQPTPSSLPPVPPPLPLGTEEDAEADDASKQKDITVEVSDPGSPTSADTKKKVHCVRCRSTRCRSACKDAPLCMIHCPILFCNLTLILMLPLLGLMWPGFEVNNDMAAFLEADSESNSIRAAFLGALPFRDPNDGGRRLAQPRELMVGYMSAVDPETMFKISSIQVLYEAPSDLADGLLNSRFLEFMQKSELALRDGKLWQELCVEKSDSGLHTLCDPGFSLANAAFPTKVLPPDGEESKEANGVADSDAVMQRLNGRGRKAMVKEVTRSILEADPVVLEQILPQKYQIGDPILSVRSNFYFNMVCGTIHQGASERGKELKKIRDLWNEFIDQELYPKLLKFVKEADKEFGVKVVFGGSGLDTYQLMGTLMNDIFMAIGSVVFIICYLTLHAGSPILSCGAMFLTVLAIPAAFIVSSNLSGSPEVTGASFLSLFLISGLGADVVLVFVAFWEASKSACDEDDYPARVKYLYHHAGLACLATTMTTAASFFANLASVLRALRSFGFFMGMCILLAYFNLLIGMPALLVINERTKRRIRRMLSSSGSSSCGSRSAKVGRFSFTDRLLIPGGAYCFAAFTISVVVCAIWTASVVQVDAGVPKMYPEGHNLNDVVEAYSKYAPSEEAFTNDKVQFCNVQKYHDKDLFKKCLLHQCQISIAGDLEILGTSGLDPTGKPQDASCKCMPPEKSVPASRCFEAKPGNASSKTYMLKVQTRIVGDFTESAMESWYKSKEFQDFVYQAALRHNPGSKQHTALANGFDTAAQYNDIPKIESLRVLSQEYWETGELFQLPYRVFEAYLLPAVVTETTSLCVAEEICYCGAAQCMFTGDDLLKRGPRESYWMDVTIPAAPERQLQVSKRPLPAWPAVQPPAVQSPAFQHAGGRRLGGTVQVSLVWGLKVSASAPLLGKLEKAWEFAEDFRAESPHTQRVLFGACEHAKKEEDLLVASHNCWIEAFRSRLRGQGKPFPVPSTQFYQELANFGQQAPVLSSGLLAKNFMWLDEAGMLKATFSEFQVRVGYNTASTGQIMTYKELWDDFVETLNGDAPPEVGDTWHTSRLWIRAEAESAIVGSTVNTLLVSVGFGFLGALCFTQMDFVLSMFVVLSVTGVTICLAWFMIAVMGWLVGAIEVLGLIVFVGYSITYSLHIAHKYQEHMDQSDKSLTKKERRREAVSHTMKCMAGAVVGSAVTTLGSSFFLFFCTLVIFVKLATVLFAVTFFAMVFATVGLPAALLVCGPTSHPGISWFVQIAQKTISALARLGQEESEGKFPRLGEGDAFATPKAGASGARSLVEQSPATSESALLDARTKKSRSEVFLTSSPAAASPFMQAGAMQRNQNSPFFPNSSPSVQPSPVGAPTTSGVGSGSFWAESFAGSASPTESAPLQERSEWQAAIRPGPPTSWSQVNSNSQMARMATAEMSKPNYRPQISII